MMPTAIRAARNLPVACQVVGLLLTGSSAGVAQKPIAAPPKR